MKAEKVDLEVVVREFLVRSPLVAEATQVVVVVATTTAMGLLDGLEVEGHSFPRKQKIPKMSLSITMAKVH